MQTTTIGFYPGNYQSDIDSGLEDLKVNEIISRIWNLDHTVWKPDSTEITNRLGWLRIAEVMKSAVPQIKAFVDLVRSDGYLNVLLLGMGGSSLAPEVFRKTFGFKDGYLDLAALDSTDPGAVWFHAEQLDYSKTLFIVATKSGATVETLSFFKYFYNQVADELGENHAGMHFTAITDPGSQLVSIAQKYRFRDTFLNDPNIGGRYSALSYFGLIPAALIGVDINRLLDSAVEMASQDELAANLGAILGVLAQEKRDKITFLISTPIQSMGDWLEQLIAESTGKEGKGILPIVNEPLGKPENYGDDRLFINIKFKADTSLEPGLEALKDAGHPVVEIAINDIYDLGGQFFLWEFATAIAGYFLKINPFDQPNVESAKILARKMVDTYKENGMLPEITATHIKPELLQEFLEQSKPGDYISLQAYIQPTKEAKSLLQELRFRLNSQYKLATTLGFGPRYLHSTGQLHKGDSGNGLFIQFTSDPELDLWIPDEAGKLKSSITFGTLKLAQALGDGEALMSRNRRFIRFHLGTDVVDHLCLLL
jgi:transaldolase/glucose-6-phosphate isomerase